VPEHDARNTEDYRRENQVKRHRAQPCSQKCPLLSEQIPDDNVTEAKGCRAREVIEEKHAPSHFRHASQQIGRYRRKYHDKPRDACGDYLRGYWVVPYCCGFCVLLPLNC
jgi:hypothetical protein